MALGETTPDHRSFSVDKAYGNGDPYTDYAWFREHDPVHVGEPGWPLGHPRVTLFRYADVMQWLKDPRMGRRFDQLPELRAARAQWQRPAPDTFAYISHRFMIYHDPPDHTRLRGMANRAFTPKLVSSRREAIERTARDLIVAFRERGGEGDLIEAFARPLPMLAIASILGVPAEDLPRFREWVGIVGSTIDTPAEGMAAAQGRVDTTTREMCEYLRSMVASRREEPKDDFVSRLIAARDEEGPLNDEDLISTCVMMIVAGHETMVNMIANGTLALMRHRDQWDRLVADPRLAGNATEELARYDSPIQFVSRIAMEDVEVDGLTVPRGSEVLFMLGSANRDEAVWDEPQRVHIDRKVGRHMAFGMGIHFCMGVPLARLEGEVAFATLAREAPELELLDPKPTWRPVLHGLQHLRVRLG